MIIIKHMIFQQQCLGMILKFPYFAKFYIIYMREKYWKIKIGLTIQKNSEKIISYKTIKINQLITEKI